MWVNCLGSVQYITVLKINICHPIGVTRYTITVHITGQSLTWFFRDPQSSTHSQSQT